jgi:rhamnosyltransferase subunit B
MDVLITTLGSHGDLHPFLAIGAALETIGHRPRVLADPFFARDVAAARLPFEPFPDEHSVSHIIRHPDLFHPLRGPRLILGELEAGMEGVAAALRQAIARRHPDLVLSHHIVLPAGWIAAEAEIPWINVTLTPAMWNDPHDPVPLFQLEPGAGPRRVARTLGRLAEPFLRRALDARVRRLRARAGFPPSAEGFWEAFRGGDLNLGMWSPALRPPLPGDPVRSTVCGFPWYDGAHGAGLDGDLERFLDAGEPPIVVTLGSAAVNTGGDLFALAARACARLGRRAVLLVGYGNDPPALPSPDITAALWAPHSRLFPRALVNVCHGGIGSTAQALRAGRPVLVIPHAYDQFNNAVRVAELGVGRMLARHRVTEARLAEELDHCATDAGLAARARALGERLGREDGAATAAAIIDRRWGGEASRAA